VTSATSELAKARLLAAGILIPEQLVTGRDVRRGKPDPEPYIRGAEKLGLAIADCVVFEDAPNGVLAGKRSGAGLVVGVGAEAMETEADLVIKGLQGISFDGKVLSIPDAIRLR
jgi:sugar-phosphatase